MIARSLFVLSIGCAAALRADASAKPSLPAALRLRGGVSSETVMAVSTGLVASSGLLSYISPKTNVEAYKVPAEMVDDTALSAMRVAGAWQLYLAALFSFPAAQAHAMSLYLSAAAILITIPPWETFKNPKEAPTIWIAILIALGKLTADGKIPAWISPALALSNGAQFHFMPESAMKMYKAAKLPGPFGMSMIGIMGVNLLIGGLYTVSLSAGLTQAQAYALAWIFNGLMAAKWAFLDADKFATPKAGPLVWTAISGIVAGLLLTK